MTYDSRPDTYAHIATVRGYMLAVAADLITRAHVHDESKLHTPEVEMFDRYTPLLGELDYGSPEYKATTKAMREDGGLEHHYMLNRHHPEFFDDGVAGMNLLDLIEMLCDWKAAGERHAGGGDIVRSIKLNRERWGYGEELERLLLNTAEALFG